MKMIFSCLLFLLFSFASVAQAGHLFTQSALNTPVHFSAGQGITVSQLSFEGASNPGLVALNFNNDWNTGDALKITVSNYTQTFTFDTPLAGASQNGNTLSVTDPTLAALALDLDAPVDWNFQAVSGDFTFAGYRIHTGNETLNGSGAGLINQSLVVTVIPSTSRLTPQSDDKSSGAAKTLDDLNGNVHGEMATVIKELTELSKSEQSKALQHIAPETNMALGAASTQIVTQALDTVSVRLEAHHSGHSEGAMFSHNNHNSLEHNPMAAGDETDNQNFWLKGFGGAAEQDIKDGYAGYDAEIYGVSAGADVLLDEKWLVGGAFTYAHTNVNMTDFRDGDGIDIDTYQLTSYMGYDFDRWYIDGMLAYAYQDYQTNRNTSFTGLASADFGGHQVSFRLISGIPFAITDWLTITPYAGTEATHLLQDSYTETGAGVLSLAVASESTWRVRGLLGSEFSSIINLNNHMTLHPAIRIGYRHEFFDDGIDSTTSFVGGGSTFLTEGQNINSDVYTIRAGIEIEQKNGLSLSLQMETEGASGYQSYAGQIVGMWYF